MHKKVFAILSFAIIFVTTVFGFFSSSVNAQTEAYCDDPLDPLGLECVRDSGLGRDDPRIIITRIINASLGLLGILATVLIIYAGFLWMTAGGNDEQAGKARSILFAAVIGLVIILSAYAIARWVLENLMVATELERGAST